MGVSNWARWYQTKVIAKMAKSVPHADSCHIHPIRGIVIYQTGVCTCAPWGQEIGPHKQQGGSQSCVRLVWNETSGKHIPGTGFSDLTGLGIGFWPLLRFMDVLWPILIGFHAYFYICHWNDLNLISLVINFKENCNFFLTEVFDDPLWSDGNFL